ncbi:MAG: hypothetical protein L0G64_06405 [Acinetobacter sp.]|uniref:hypothetical protein n=2 Tax=Acinetobacter sp. TaxID=472 RepID=UPI002647EC55|nr:hypothetical protein [Acinetobacter sp.]MDN5511939.1 hypothetical protein [Acinetobacter sp.]
MIYDNEALRLHETLQKLKTISGNTRLSDAFAVVLQVDAKNLSKVLIGIGQLNTYVDSIAQYCKDSPSIALQFERWSPKINQAFSTIHINNALSQFTQYYNEEVLFLIKTTHLALTERIEHKIILEKEKIDQLIVELEELKQDFESKDISPSVKSYILNQLNELINNLKQYEILGSSNIQGTIESSIGHLITSDEYANFMKTDPLGRSLLDKLVAIGAGLQIIESGTQILVNTQQYLANVC